MKAREITSYLFSILPLILGLCNESIYPSDRTRENNTDSQAIDPANEIKITILYDNYVAREGTQNDWGFACLIEGLEKIILFDTGAKGDLLLANSQKLGVDLTKAGLLFFSHNHEDHTGGIKTVLGINPDLKVMVPNSFPQDFTEKYNVKNLVRILTPQKICPDAYSTGELGDQIKEQSLVIDTQKGLIVITGCSHPGIVDILRKVKDEFKKDIYLVIGGFHLLQHSNEAMEEIISEFHNLGVTKCGATHCTGEKQIQLLEKSLGKDYIRMGTGRIVTINSDGLTLK